MYDFEYCMKVDCKSCKKKRECDVNEHSRKYKQINNSNKTKRKRSKNRNKNVLLRRGKKVIEYSRQGNIFYRCLAFSLKKGQNVNKKEGNGIGLSIVKRIVDLHEGEISVESKDGLTTFTVKLN